MKKPYFTLVVLVLITTVSCQNFLEVQNQKQLSNDSFWKTDADAQQGITSVYAALSAANGDKWTFFEEIFLGLTLRSDEAANNQSSGYGAKLASFTPVADESTGYNLWVTRYAGIARANQVIQFVPNINSDEISDEKKKSYIGEAKFLRALNYFYLVCSFENIPKETEFIDDYSKITPPPQVPPGEIWALIESDLLEAEKFLPGTYPDQWLGRATKWAAKSLLGKVYLFQEKWGQASAKFAEVINSGQYSLLPNYGDNFNGLGENGSESVFEIQFSGDRSNGADRRHPMNWEFTPDALKGWELLYASNWILDEMKKDKASDGSYSDRVYESLFFDDPKSVMRNPTGTKDISYPSVKSKLTFPQYFKKYNKWTDINGNYVGTNVSMIRYADVLLMYAEALNEAAGNVSAAIEQINVVRARSKAAPLTASNFTKEQLRTQIRHHERPCELSLEYGIRWLDLYRWSRGKTFTERLKTTLVNHGKAFAKENFKEGTHEINPIPAQEIALTNNLQQNNGY